MIPSPDWIVGLSKENLCLANCSWVDNRVIDLYPWDIGTDRYLIHAINVSDCKSINYVIIVA